MCPGDVPRYPKEVSVKKMEQKKMNLKNLSQISETSPYMLSFSFLKICVPADFIVDVMIMII